VSVLAHAAPFENPAATRPAPPNGLGQKHSLAAAKPRRRSRRVVPEARRWREAFEVVA